jgi:prolyl-tRNA synthetase
VGERGLKEGRLEYQGRRDPASTPVPIADLLAFVKARLCAH